MNLRNIGVATVVAAAALGGGAAGSSASPSSRALPGVLPAPSFSSTTWHEGDSVTVSGTGCLDPDTSTTDGLQVVVYRASDGGRSGLVPLATIRPTLAADGSYTGSATIEQPLYPTGPVDVWTSCEPEGSPNPYDAVLLAQTKATLVPPSLPDLTVRAGTSFDQVLPCTVVGGGYGTFAYTLGPDGDPAGYLAVSGADHPASDLEQGDEVAIPVPADIAPGTYDASARCSVSEAGTQAYFAGFQVTVLAATASTTTSTTPPPPTGSAPAATPVAGTADYTG